MHELSIALSLVELATEELKRVGDGARATAVHLRVGALSGVVRDALLFSYDIACQDTPLAGSQLIIEDVPVVVFCERCQEQRPIISLQSFCCAECGAPTPDIREGKELQLVALEVEQ
jgi:hydrogenase nickel incorporation protein HypA/HybF